MDLLTDPISAVILILLAVSTVPSGGGVYSTLFPVFELRLPRFPSRFQWIGLLLPTTFAEMEMLGAPANISGCVVARLISMDEVATDGESEPPPQAVNESALDKQRIVFQWMKDALAVVVIGV